MPTERIEFTIGPDTQLRKPDDAGVGALDDALAALGPGGLLHLMDPRRILAFAAGGPPVWSVAYAPVGPVGRDHLFVTYGLSDRIDPERQGCGFELSIRVPAAQGAMWPGLFLRALAR